MTDEDEPDFSDFNHGRDHSTGIVEMVPPRPVNAHRLRQRLAELGAPTPAGGLDQQEEALLEAVAATMQRALDGLREEWDRALRKVVRDVERMLNTMWEEVQSVRTEITADLVRHTDGQLDEHRNQLGRTIEDRLQEHLSAMSTAMDGFEDDLKRAQFDRRAVEATVKGIHDTLANLAKAARE